jgi:FdhD protein
MAEIACHVLRYSHDQTAETEDLLAIEEPLEIRVGGRPVSVTMRSPGHDDELSAGFLLTEGIISRPQDLARIDQAENVADATLGPGVALDFDRLTRHVFASSSCGLCGKATIQAIQTQFRPIDSSLVIDARTILALPPKMRAAQATFDRTGGLHAAALFDADGQLIVMREDVGRHNAVDKVLGHALINELVPLGRHILLVSGRSSFEITQKALAARIPIVAAVSAPSSLAVQFAQECGQTLLGFVRDQRMNVYANPQRIRFR